MHSSHHAAPRSLLIQQALLDAMAHTDLEMHYQGQYRLADQRLIGVEALSRLQTPTLGVISPEEFIDIAEQTGLIAQWEQRVLQQVRNDWLALDQRHPQLRMSVNFSILHITQKTFFESFHQWVSELPPTFASRLDFEITETWIQSLSPELIEQLQQLRSRGIRIVMDDFGVGHSSLSRLHTLPFDTIKLDRHFVSHLDEPMVQAIVTALVRLTHQFDKTLIIEGVETQQQCELVASLGGDLVQGFYFGQPQPRSYWLDKYDAQV